MRLRITAAAAIWLIAAGIAAAEVTVYENGFSSRAAIADLEKLEGGDVCERRWVKKDKRLAIEIQKNEETCVYATPVRGDAKEPDHQLEVEATVSKDVPKSRRDEVFVAIGVRSSPSSGYELRVMPGTREWEVRRDPGVGEFPIRGADQEIAGVGKSNKLSIQAFDDRITASVNGKKLVDGVVDPSAADVDGRRTTISFGTEAASKDPMSASFDDLKVRIPNP